MGNVQRITRFLKGLVGRLLTNKKYCVHFITVMYHFLPSIPS